MRLMPRTASRKPRGKVLVFMAILLPAIMGFMALAVDISVVAASRAQLNTVADAAALSGAMKLADEMRVRRTTTDLTPEITAAQAEAQTVGQDNLVLSAVPVFLNNTSNSSSGDIVVGYVDPKTHQWTAPPLANSLLANSVMVTAQRNSNHGGLVPGLFSRTWGYQGTTVNFNSIATCWNYPIIGFKPAGSSSASSPNAYLLPIVLDVNTWNAMMTQSSATTDMYAFSPANYNPPSSTGVSLGSDGVYESNLYPVGTDPGNWGTIDIGIEDNSTSTLISQILYGITPSQLAQYPNSTIKLNTSLSPPSITFDGNPGISAALQSALTSIIGRPVTIPIYDQTSGTGATVTYRVVDFQPCRIMSVNFQATPKYAIIQPCLTRDPTAIPQTDSSKWPANWGWQWGGAVRVHLTH